MYPCLKKWWILGYIPKIPNYNKNQYDLKFIRKDELVFFLNMGAKL